MGDAKPSLRIDWFDGTLIEDNRPDAATTSQFADEHQPDDSKPSKPMYVEKKPIGFKRLLDISFMDPPPLILEISTRNSFWMLLNMELKGDFIVLIITILAKLYKSMQTGLNSMLITILKRKFQESKFTETLSKYLVGLPQVRVIEKRMNSHLWDDVESFYFNVLAVCFGMFQFGGNTKEHLECLLNLLEMLEMSAVGVKEEHTERLSDELFLQIHSLKTKIIEINEQVPETQNEFSDLSQDKFSDMSSYKNLHIFPTKDDLLGKQQIDIKPNIINGAYPNVECYLDLQFKLLREDYFGPLREGINKYIQNPTKRRHENIRVHPKVRIIRTYVSNNRVGHLVDIAWSQRHSHNTVDSKRYAYSKQLMFGSLLLFTCDNFETILCATVLDSNLHLLNDGYVAVSFQNPVSKKIFSVPYLMVESEVFFEPYHRVLKVLQSFKLDDLPMRKYIVDVKPESQPPSYLTSNTIYTIQKEDPIEEISFPVLDTENWPSNSTFGFDKSQMEAYKFALTREFAVIQGPPGTGKTYLGIKIASTLLKNLSLEGTPMLIICYTNHALDQFLEGILNVTENIIRLGSQSKSKMLEPYTLNNARVGMKSKYSHLYSSKRTELEKIYNKMIEIQCEIEKCEKEVLTYKTIKTYLKVDGKRYELNAQKEDPILNWLFSNEEDEEESPVEDWEKQEDLEELNDLIVDDEKLETCFSEEWALKEIDSMKNSIKYLKDVTDDHMEEQKMTTKFETQIDRVKRRLKIFKKNLCEESKDDLRGLLMNVKDLYSLTPEQRWKVYLAVVKVIKNEFMAKMNVLLEQHNTCSDELSEVSTLIDSEAMRWARVVGVTTSAAARRHDLLRRLMAPIVIVEEAAELLEAHIVASLTYECQHLILIGDHKQLRPTAAHYKLAKDYNLEVSLFERMVRNGVHARALTTQRRMRANMTRLLVPVVYGTLDTHPVAYDYPDVRGMKDNLYFYSHDVAEDVEDMEDSWSHKNTFEARWCVALANYLRQMKYTSEEITILATYTGQATLIKELSRQYSTLDDVKITVVDNYQGEENRIVILSLVRSNKEGRIGFLAAVNRICVALSRAKEGLYIFGNMNALKSSSTVWRHINDELMAQQAIGKRLTVRCCTHRDNMLEITHYDHFDGCLQGACLMRCDK